MSRAMEVLRPTDILILREVGRRTASAGASRLSTRQIAEVTGVTRKTVVRSLARLAQSGQIEKVRAGVGFHPTQWRATGNLGGFSADSEMARTTPRRTNEYATPDAFRRRDLRGPWALYDDLPDDAMFTSADVLAFTQLTGRVRTVDAWLLILASQKWPLVDELRHGGSIEGWWRKNQVEDWQLEEIAAHLRGIAANGSDRAPRSRRQMKLEHELERVNSSIRLAVPKRAA